MKLQHNGEPVHLSYCTNIHAGEHWSELEPQLRQHLPAVRHALALDEPFGIGLRLSKQCLDGLEQTAELAAFKNWLQENHCYIFTINGFPYGTFHGEPVKENVYRPDWTDVARLEYTCRLATLLAKLDPPEQYGTISTLPGTFKGWADGALPAITENLLQAVTHCVALQRETGITIALALEPEPCCLLETADEAVAFFKEQLFRPVSVQRLTELADLSRADAETALRTHLGICFDVCHSAVEFEDPVRAIMRLQSAGVPIIKIQLSSALRIETVNEASLRALKRFDEPVYLHQVVERCGRQLTRYSDLGAAIAERRRHLEQRSTLHPSLQLRSNAFDGNTALAMAPIDAPPAEWRVHFHVPVFMGETEQFGTTQSVLEQILLLQRRHGLCRHLEVETYTWDVLPEGTRDVSVSDAIARELAWVRERL